MADDEQNRSASTTTNRLVVLQAIDTEADQLRHRSEHLPEREDNQRRAAAVADWENRRDAMLGRIEVLQATVESAERETERLEAARERLEAQLKTVIAPREAEALMNEIATLDAERDTAETAELEAMEEQTELEAQLEVHARDGVALARALDDAASALGSALSEIEASLAELDRRREDARAGIDAAMLARYDRVRAHLGVAVATLEGKKCSGCHLDLSAAEIDAAREEAAATEGVTDCPQCGRILIA